MRTFVAVPLTTELASSVVEVQERIRRCGLPAKWVEPHNLHFTLKFLGEVDEGVVEDVCQGVAGACRRFLQFGLELGGVGAFPGPGRPRVVWIGVTGGASTLTALAGEIEDRLAEAGFPREPRRFSPHLTLARLREEARPPADSLARFGEELVRCRGLVVGSMQVVAACVMKSTLTPRGPTYEVIQTARLGPPVGASLA